MRVFFIVLAIVVLIDIYVVSVYNELVSARDKVENQFD